MFIRRSETTIGRLTFRIILSLGALALLAGIVFWGKEAVIKVEKTRATVVNIAGRQRMLSQRIVVLATLLAASTNPAKRADLRRDLQEAIAAMETAHTALLHGDPSLGLPGNPSPEVQSLYFEPPVNLDAQIRDYLAGARALAQAPETELAPDNALLQDTLTAAESGLLDALEAVVSRYQAERNSPGWNAWRCWNWSPPC